MSGAHSITVDVDDATMAIVHRVTKRRGISSLEFAAEAIRRAAESDDDFDAFVQVGIDAADRGDVVSQEEMEAWFEARVREHVAR